MATRIVHVGLIGCGEVAQVIHIPNLLHMNSFFRITHLCDVSPSSLSHCATKIPNPDLKTTASADDLCADPEVEVVMVVNSDEYHAEHVVLALAHDKHVLIEKPVALTRRDVQKVLDAEKKSKGRVMVGYMRRYAMVFEDAVEEIGGMDRIDYARVRDIIGSNSFFVDQSGTFPIKPSDFSAEDTQGRTQRAEEQVKTAMAEVGGGVPVNDETTRMWRLLGGLGSHDLSLMREAIGMPDRVVGSSLGTPFWNALLKYPTFTVSYESGIDNIPRFDAHIEIYSASKSVRVQYDTPYVKGLPITMHVSENANGAYKETTIRKTYEDPYTIELRKLYGMVVRGDSVKTTVADAMDDLVLFGMIMRHHYGTS
ncbi:uncharacterized protein J7T54_004544 [Emericellopsis cladophorae]|uniref:Gfo/Idh/MocA-like oxidoreductase N-terminal domain-containing protein n=1 Tax=Emericellopsis cladophorae TaxID=2686198 RepID=A0A9P9Y6J3_9HYPO|nr:uncharacterized protein J7T54_004544 [Emericellopsis cladophorae]KAI6783998.1 hypothetical protein J7T54_004544 [Emericellopsis cladophorae]